VALFAAEVIITLKDGVLDPEGSTVQRSLADLGYSGVESVGMGKRVVVRLEASDETAARELVADMCRRLLANPVLEDFTLTVAPEAGSERGEGR